jgi:hypothetical protein
MTKKRQPDGPVIETLIFRCILSLAVASVAAVLFLSVMSPSP